MGWECHHSNVTGHKDHTLSSQASGTEPCRFCFWLLAVFGGITSLGSFKSQAPSSREVPSPKPQRAALDGHHLARALVWSLRFGASLVLGALMRYARNG